MRAKLHRCLGFTSAYFILVGSVIGSGVFLVAAEIATAVPSPALALAVWVAAGLISLAGALIFAELGAMYPAAGGQYVFLQKAFHPVVSFLFGWALILVIQTGSIAAVGVGFARFLSHFVPLAPTSMKIVASLLIAALTLLNTRGVKAAAYFLDGVTSLKVVAILALVAACLLLPHQSAEPLAAAPTTFSALGVALIASFWAYDGWTSLSFVAGEIEKPQRNIPLASLAGIASVTALYVLVNLGYYRVLATADIAHSSFVAADAANAVLGGWGERALTVLVLLSAVGCINGLILSGARVVYAMGRDGSLPAVCARVNAKTHTPDGALWLQCTWSLVLVWSGSYDELFTYVIFAAFLFYGLTALAVMKLRRDQPLVSRPYKVPLYPWLPFAYLAFTSWFMVNAFLEKPRESLAGLAILAVGLPFYHFRAKRIAASRITQ